MTTPASIKDGEAVAAPPTMSSIELVQVINDLREVGKAELRHDNFLKKIEKVLGSDSPKFLGEYRDSTGRPLKCYYLPKREASLMVMSESYSVQAKVYDRMTELEGAANNSLSELPPEQRALVALMVDNAKIKAKQGELAAAQAAQQDSIKRIEAKQSAIENGAAFFTVIGFGVMRNIKFSLTDAAAIGRRASVLSKAAGIQIDKVRDPRFGEVNSYHESMLDAALTELHGGM